MNLVDIKYSLDCTTVKIDDEACSNRFRSSNSFLMSTDKPKCFSARKHLERLEPLERLEQFSLSGLNDLNKENSWNLRIAAS